MSRENKFADHAVMMKLTTYLRNRFQNLKRNGASIMQGGDKIRMRSSLKMVYKCIAMHTNVELCIKRTSFECKCLKKYF